MTTADGRCENPKCTCSPCTCEDCRCGGMRLGVLERRVMEVLWSDDRELNGREVADRLPEYAYTTIATVLDRLSHKGEVRRRRAGRRIQYAATRTPAAHTALAMQEALENTDDVHAALADFVARLPLRQRRFLSRALDAHPRSPARRTDHGSHEVSQPR